MIQTHGKLFIKSLVLAIYIIKLNFHWQHHKTQFSLATQKTQLSMAISKAQFSLATSKNPVLTGNIKNPNFHWQYRKPNSHWQYQKPNLRWHYFIKSPRLLTLGKKYYVYFKWTMFLKHYYCKNHGNHFIKAHGKLSWKLGYSSHIINLWMCDHHLHHNIHNIFLQSSW